MAPLTEQQRLDLIRRAIQTSDGWKALAQSVISYEGSKEHCLEQLRTIAGNREVDAVTPEGLVKVKLADVFAQQLDENIALLELAENTNK